jgi:hypothetical protein
MLIFHIIIALASMIAAGIAFFFPTEKKLRASYVLVALTLITGTYLVWSTHAHIISACTTGLIYLALVGTGIVSARTKLSYIRSEVGK